MTGLMYDSMAKMTTAVFSLEKVFIRKVTHAMRVGGAQYLEGQG